VAGIQTSTQTCPSYAAAVTERRNAYSSQHGEARIVHVFGTGVLAEETFPYETEEAVSMSDDVGVEVRGNGSRSACATEVAMGSVMGNVDDLWTEANDGLWARANIDLWVEANDDEDFCSFGRLHYEVGLCSP
jgi:hypothetical protein